MHNLNLDAVYDRKCSVFFIVLFSVMFDLQFLAFSKKSFNTVISFFMAEKPIVYICNNFFICYEYISWFHFLTVGDSAAISMDVLVSLWYIDLRVLRVYTHEWRSYHMVVLFLASWGTSTEAGLSYITTIVYKNSFPCHILTSICGDWFS